LNFFGISRPVGLKHTQFRNTDLPNSSGGAKKKEKLLWWHRYKELILRKKEA